MFLRHVQIPLEQQKRLLNGLRAKTDYEGNCLLMRFLLLSYYRCEKGSIFLIFSPFSFSYCFHFLSLSEGRKGHKEVQEVSTFFYYSINIKKPFGNKDIEGLYRYRICCLSICDTHLRNNNCFL